MWYCDGDDDDDDDDAARSQPGSRARLHTPQHDRQDTLTRDSCLHKS